MGGRRYVLIMLSLRCYDHLLAEVEEGLCYDDDANIRFDPSYRNLES